MEDLVNSLIRSVIEALTEFLPVSSTGHLFLFSYFFPFQNLSSEFDDLFDIFIQAGAILSILVLYWSKFKVALVESTTWVLGRSEDRSGFDFLFRIAVGTLPVLAVGFLARGVLDELKSREDLLLILAGSWSVGGLFLIVSELWIHRRPAKEEEINLWEAICIGIFQCIALIPGVSRSAATIVTARFLRKTKRDSAEFSFFLAVPALLAASFYKLYKHWDVIQLDTLPPLLLGFFGAFLFCIVVIRWFMGFLQSHTFIAFGYYRILLGSLVFTWYLYTH